MNKYIGAFFLCMFIIGSSVAQTLVTQFSTGGAAMLHNGTITLTPAEEYKKGWAYALQKADLSLDFTISFTFNLGSNDYEGADGIAFVLHNDNRGLAATGLDGGAIGYSAIQPSIVIELDTYQNGDVNDPYDDHIDYMENGDTYHHGAQVALLGQIEDGLDHTFTFEWQACKNVIIVTIDGKQLIYGKRTLSDLMKTKMVYWGFTGATGLYFNKQVVKNVQIGYSRKSFPKVDLGADRPFVAPQMQLDPGKFEQYSWQNGSRVRVMKAKTAGKYWVTVANEVGCTASDTLLLTDPNNPTANTTNNNNTNVVVDNTPKPKPKPTDDTSSIQSGNVNFTKLKVGESVVLDNIFFKRGKSDLLPESYSELDKVVQFMQRNPTCEIEISGHTELSHADPQLSNDRANAVSGYIVSKGIDQQRVIAKGYANSRPVTYSTDPDEQARNRRVEFKILKM